MIFCRLVIILLFLCWGANARAQVSGDLSSMPEQWQLSLDVVKSKARGVVVENNGLKVQYRQLIEQLQKYQRLVDDQMQKNEQTERFLQERHGRTDQQARTEELTQAIKTKNQQARAYDEQLKDLQKKKSDVDHNIRQLKYTISDIELHRKPVRRQALIPQNTVSVQADDQSASLRKQLEEAGQEEALLENKMGALKTGDKMKTLNADALEAENKQLESRLQILRLQKLRHEKESSDAQLSQAGARMYEQLRARKEKLEAQIYSYESRIDELRKSSLEALSWPSKKKTLVHEMVKVDAGNNQMRGKINNLREDIGVLRDQVARLERRLDFAQGQVTKP